MATDNYSPQIYVLATDSTEADVTGQAVLSADFDQAEIDLTFQDSLDCEVVVFVSNQYFAPDVSLPVSQDNSYSQVGYVNMLDQTFYSAANPIVPSAIGTDGVLTLNIEYVGARWLIVATRNRTTGTLNKLQVTLFDNK